MAVSRQSASVYIGLEHRELFARPLPELRSHQLLLTVAECSNFRHKYVPKRPSYCRRRGAHLAARWRNAGGAKGCTSCVHGWHFGRDGCKPKLGDELFACDAGREFFWLYSGTRTFVAVRSRCQIRKMIMRHNVDCYFASAAHCRSADEYWFEILCYRFIERPSDIFTVIIDYMKEIWDAGVARRKSKKLESCQSSTCRTRQTLSVTLKRFVKPLSVWRHSRTRKPCNDIVNWTMAAFRTCLHFCKKLSMLQ